MYWIRTSDAEIKGTTTYFQMFAYSGSYMTFYQIDSFYTYK